MVSFVLYIHCEMSERSDIVAIHKIVTTILLAYWVYPPKTILGFAILDILNGIE